MVGVLTFWSSLLNFCGALLLVLFSLPGLTVTRDGQNFFPWTSTPPLPEEVKRNKQKYWLHAILSKAGLIVLMLGFLLQMLPVAFPQWFDSGLVIFFPTH